MRGDGRITARDGAGTRGARGGRAAARRRRASRATPAPGSSCCASPPAASAAPISSCARAIWRCAATPIVPGHQIVGRVEAVGAGVDGWRVGDRAGVAWLAGSRRHLRQVPLRPREPVRARHLHRLGRRRRLCDARDRARRLRAADPRRLRRSRRGAAAVRRGDRLPVAQAQRHRAGRPARPLRLRRLGPHHAADRAALGLPHLRRHPLGGRTGARAVAGRRMGRRLRRPAARAARRGDHVRASGDVVRAALRAVDRGATVAINAIHLDRLPEMPYEELWWERRLAASRTSRAPTPASSSTWRRASRFARRSRHIRSRTRTSRWRGCLAARSAAPPSSFPRAGCRAGSGRRSPGRSRSPTASGSRPLVLVEP